ncbi:MAG: alpha/beta hydrolase [Ruminococcaceae bacterium]|nr:alpha/beta hydrolase [Oscillospiraceae bacterium]
MKVNKVKFFSDKRKRKIFIISLSVLLVIATIFGACAIYVSDYYRADDVAIEAFLAQDELWQKDCSFYEDDGGNIIFAPENATSGLIFYPGGKVEHKAYIPLMRACAERGILCVIAKMPFNLAVLDINAATDIRAQHTGVEHWYIGGHSLGGSMAASYFKKHTADFEGLVLLGAYSTADISNADINVLSIYGDKDGVMNMEKYNKNKPNLPSDMTEIVIEGGCHAYFGMYGAQDGDGIPTVTNEEQIYITANAIADMMGE